MFLALLYTSSGAHDYNVDYDIGRRAGDKIEKNEMGWVCGAYGWTEEEYRVLVGKPEGKRPLGRPRRRWVYNIRMNLQEVGCGYMDWIGLA